MSRKDRLLTCGMYTVVSFVVLLFGFTWQMAIPIAVIVGFTLGLINELITILIWLREDLKKILSDIDKKEEGEN